MTIIHFIPDFNVSATIDKDSLITFFAELKAYFGSRNVLAPDLYSFHINCDYKQGDHSIVTDKAHQFGFVPIVFKGTFEEFNTTYQDGPFKPINVDFDPD